MKALKYYSLPKFEESNSLSNLNFKIGEFVWTLTRKRCWLPKIKRLSQQKAYGDALMV